MAFVREAVSNFAEEMEKKLRKHDADRPGWDLENVPDALVPIRFSLYEHVHKLLDLLEEPNLNLDKVISSAADVGNFAMMIADNAARWKDEAENV